MFLFVFLCVVGGAILCFFLSLYFTEIPEEYSPEAKKKKEEEKLLQDFYLKCKNEKLTNLASRSEIERVKLIADSMGVPMEYRSEEAIRSCFASSAEKELEEEKKKQEEAKKKHLSDLENERLELVKYSQYFGRDKQIAFYKDKLDEAKKIIDDSPIKFANDMKFVTGLAADCLEPPKAPEKEDWALLGGLASGIGGPAAGMATAINAQRNNARNEAQHKRDMANYHKQKSQLRAEGESFSKMVQDRITQEDRQKYSSATSEKYKYEKLIERAKIRLVEENNSQDLLSLINPVVHQVKVEEDGSMRTDFTLKCPVETIFDNVSAIVDGSFDVTVLDSQNKAVGTMKVVIPEDGLIPSSQKKVRIARGMLVSGCEPRKEYHFEFTNPRLWLIEMD